MGNVLRRLFAFLALLPAAAFAQFPPGMQLPNVEYNPLLMLNASVQKELRISPAAGAKIQQAFLNDAMKLMPALSGGVKGKAPLTDAQRAKLTLKGIDEMQAHMAALLNPAQKVRLRQLTLQSIGAAAVLQPKVAKGLGLSPTQREKLTARISDANETMANRLNRSRRPAEWRNQMGEMTRLQAEAKAQSQRALMSTLTPAQQAKWKTMLGKPFPMTGFLGVGNLFPGR